MLCILKHTVDPQFLILVGREKNENTKQWYRNVFSGPKLESKKW